MMYYKNTKGRVTHLIETQTSTKLSLENQKGNTLAPLLRMSIDVMKENSFRLKNKKNPKKQTDRDYIPMKLRFKLNWWRTASHKYTCQQGEALATTCKSIKHDSCVLYKKGAISILSGKPPKLMEQSSYFGIHISFTEKDINIPIGNALTAVNFLLINCKSSLSDKKRCFFQSVSLSAQLYWCSTLNLAKRTEKKLDDTI